MTHERRRYPRRATPRQGTWRGASGETTCRISDISWGGCFIETKAEPGVGEQTVVAVPTRDGMIELPGRVVKVDRGFGFSVQFEQLTRQQYDALYPILGEPAPPAPHE